MFLAITISLVIAMFSINTIYLFKTYAEINPIPYISGKIPKDSYLEKRLPEYKTIQFANRIKRQGDKDAQAFSTSERPYKYEGIY